MWHPSTEGSVVTVHMFSLCSWIRWGWKEFPYIYIYWKDGTMQVQINLWWLRWFLLDNALFGRLIAAGAVMAFMLAVTHFRRNRFCLVGGCIFTKFHYQRHDLHVLTRIFVTSGHSSRAFRTAEGRVRSGQLMECKHVMDLRKLQLFMFFQKSLFA